MERMTKEQFQREGDYRIAMSVMRAFLRQGFLTREEFKKAEMRLQKIFEPIWGHLPDGIELGNSYQEKP